MKRVLINLWTDDCGALLATEWVVLATLVVLGIIPGLVAIRNGVLHELKDVSNATSALDQSYEFTGNELVSPESEWAPVETASRRTAGNGSLTELVASANNRGGTRQTTATQAPDGRTAIADGRDPSSRPCTARTGGSAFVRGNHAVDGRDRHAGAKTEDIRPPEQQAQSQPATETAEDLDE
jgi:hypothetical protein